MSVFQQSFPRGFCLSVLICCRSPSVFPGALRGETACAFRWGSGSSEQESIASPTGYIAVGGSVSGQSVHYRLSKAVSGVSALDLPTGSQSSKMRSPNLKLWVTDPLTDWLTDPLTGVGARRRQLCNEKKWANTLSNHFWVVTCQITYLIFVKGTTGAARVKNSVRCKLFQIERKKYIFYSFWGKF